MVAGELLKMLKSIDKPIVTEYVHLDTGIHFKILTNESGYYCFGGNAWPIEGPFKFEETAFNATNKLIRAGLKCYDDYFEALNKDSLPELQKAEIEAFRKLSEVEMDILFDMVKDINCLPDREYYMYSDDSLSVRYFYEDHQSAKDHLISAFTLEGFEWDVMDDDELAEWVEVLKNTRS